MEAPALTSAMFVQLPVLHEHLSQPCSSQTNFLPYTNIYLSHVRRSPIACPTPDTYLSHVRRSPTSCTTPQPCSSQSSFLYNTNTYLNHVRCSPTSCPTATLVSAMFVAVQLPVLHQYSSQPYSSQSNFQSYTDTHLSSVPLDITLVFRNLIN